MLLDHLWFGFPRLYSLGQLPDILTHFIHSRHYLLSCTAFLWESVSRRYPVIPPFAITVIGDILPTLVLFAVPTHCFCLATSRTFKLRMPDHNRIVLSCCNSSYEPFSIFWLKVFFIRHHNVSRRIELHKFSADLTC